MVFGANNVQVNSPSWLLGHFSVNDVLFGYNRVFVVGFAIVINTFVDPQFRRVALAGVGVMAAGIPIYWWVKKGKGKGSALRA